MITLLIVIWILFLLGVLYWAAFTQYNWNKQHADGKKPNHTPFYLRDDGQSFGWFVAKSIPSLMILGIYIDIFKRIPFVEFIELVILLVILKIMNYLSSYQVKHKKKN